MTSNESQSSLDIAKWAWSRRGAEKNPRLKRKRFGELWNGDGSWRKKSLESRPWYTLVQQVIHSTSSQSWITIANNRKFWWCLMFRKKMIKKWDENVNNIPIKRFFGINFFSSLNIHKTRDREPLFKHFSGTTAIQMNQRDIFYICHFEFLSRFSVSYLRETESIFSNSYKQFLP